MSAPAPEPPAQTPMEPPPSLVNTPTMPQLVKAIQILYDAPEAASLISSNIEVGRGYKNKLKRALAKELERRLRDGSLDLCIGTGRAMMLDRTQFAGSARHDMPGGVFGSSGAARLASGLTGRAATTNAMLAYAIMQQQQQQQQHTPGLRMPHAGLPHGGGLTHGGLPYAGLVPSGAGSIAPGHWSALGWNPSGTVGGGSAAGMQQQRLKQQQMQQAQRIEQFHRTALLGRQRQQQQQQQQQAFQQQLMLAQQRHAHAAAAAGGPTTAPLVCAPQPGGSFASAPRSAGVGGAPSRSAPWALTPHAQQQAELERRQGAEVSELRRKHAQQKEQLAACMGNELLTQRQHILTTLPGTKLPGTRAPAMGSVSVSFFIYRYILSESSSPLTRSP